MTFLHDCEDGLESVRTHYKPSFSCYFDAHVMFSCVCFITKTCLYIFYPFKPHFYIVKLGFIGVYIIFYFAKTQILGTH